MSTVVVDPITRIEGHLRIEVETQGDEITDARSSGTMFRGIEQILKGRDPRDAWAFTQRFCGVCTVSNSIASVRAVEAALNYPIPPNAQIIRNLMMGTQYVHDHVMHFFHLHALDWIDIVSALDADPAATASLQQSLSPSRAPEISNAAYFGTVKGKLSDFVSSGQLGIYATGYWGHEGYKCPPEVNLMAFAHYLEALAWQRDVAKVLTLFGGKNPHPNFSIGGVPCAIEDPLLTLPGSIAVTMNNLNMVGELITKMQTFVDQIYLRDILAIASFYKDWATPFHGEGVGNFLTFGEFPQSPDINDLGSLFVPRGAILDRDLSTIHDVDLEALDEIQEHVTHSWYRYRGGVEALHPYEGETRPNYTGPTPPFALLSESNDPAYSWVKSPRWNGEPMEVGPLARVLMQYASGHAATVDQVNGALAILKLPLASMYSTLGRMMARAIEAKIIADQMSAWHGQLMSNIAAGDRATHDAILFDPETWPQNAQGVGFQEAPRGALAHWIKIRAKKIDNYQAVIPTTWNAGPRDSANQMGPYEAALLGHTLADPSQPLEILRTIHSFDPCLACAVHVVDPNGEELVQVKVL
jgi:hydrogenase large subunit